MDLQGKKVTVVGMGKTGTALARLLKHTGAIPFVTESAPPEKKAETIAELDAMGVAWECGGHTEKALSEADLIVPSPGVNPEKGVCAEAVEQGIPIVGEMEFAWRYLRTIPEPQRPRILAVTGTNGKTTTTELLYTLVAACGETVALAGNNAFPLSAAVLLDPLPNYIVLEVSSYQLQLADTFRPWLATVMNVTLDHLARHGTMENYAAVKARIYRNQGPGDAAILNADDSWTTAMTAPENTALWTYSLDRARGMASFGPRLSRDIWLSGETILAEGLPIASTGDTPLQGRHNMQNVLAALTMMRAGGFPWPKVLEGLRTFCGVEHRLEFAGEWNGIRFINDSKATNVDSLKVALETFEEPVILIAGGEGKQSDYTVLNGLVRKHVRELVTLGLDAPNIEAAWGEIAPFHRVADMGEAVECAARLARGGEVVLLSPACASFDMYQSFEHRGRDFKERVLAFIGKNGGDGRHET